MSLQKNIAASFASQIYVTLISIVMVPLYVRYMGAEAYGLVGFFAMLQSWFSLLDVGLTPTISRETARFRGGAIDALTYRRLVRALEYIFLAVALVGGASMLLAAWSIAGRWLHASHLSIDEVRVSVQVMAVIIALRWMAGLYRGSITGAEGLVWLGSFNASIATLRFSGVLPLLMFVGTSPTLFFGYQFVIAVLELMVLMVHAYRQFPAVAPGVRLPWDWTPLKPVLRFSLTIAFTSSAWILVTQTDKLVLSKILPLADYGYYTLAVLVAGGITILTGPLGSAIMPRMARLEAQGEHSAMIDVYRHSTQIVAVLAGAAAMTAAFSAHALLWAWTGNADLARESAPVLRLYALGNGVLAVAAFPYYLQFAKGDLRLHLIGNAGFVVLLVPLVIWAASRHGAVGAGYVWLSVNLLAFVAWLPLVHRKFEPGLNLRWYCQDIGVIFCATAGAGYLAHMVLPPQGSRWQQFVQIMVAGAITLAAGALASSAVRARLRNLWQRPALSQL